MTKAEAAVKTVSVERLVAALKAAGAKHATAETVQKDLDDGAPVGADGGVDLIAYFAWMSKRHHART